MNSDDAEYKEVSQFIVSISQDRQEFIKKMKYLFPSAEQKREAMIEFIATLKYMHQECQSNAKKQVATLAADIANCQYQRASQRKSSQHMYSQRKGSRHMSSRHMSSQRKGSEYMGAMEGPSDCMGQDMSVLRQLGRDAGIKGARGKAQLCDRLKGLSVGGQRTYVYNQANIASGRAGKPY